MVNWLDSLWLLPAFSVCFVAQDRSAAAIFRDGEFPVNVMEFVFVFFFFIEVFRIYFLQVVEIVLALLIDAFMYAKKGPVSFGDKAVTAMRAFEF